MNKQDKIANPETKILIEKSGLKIKNPDFTDMLMAKIEAKTCLEFSFKKYLKLSWFFIILSALILPLSIDMVISNFNTYFPYFELYLPVNTQSLMLFLIVGMVLIILFQIDKLINMTLKRGVLN